MLLNKFISMEPTPYFNSIQWAMKRLEIFLQDASVSADAKNRGQVMLSFINASSDDALELDMTREPPNVWEAMQKFVDATKTLHPPTSPWPSIESLHVSTTLQEENTTHSPLLQIDPHVESQPTPLPQMENVPDIVTLSFPLPTESQKSSVNEEVENHDNTEDLLITHKDFYLRSDGKSIFEDHPRERRISWPEPWPSDAEDSVQRKKSPRKIIDDEQPSIKKYKPTIQRHSKWTQDEIDALWDGVSKYGKGNWAIIRSNYRKLEGYNAVQLKDKWRNIIRYIHSSPSSTDQEKHKNVTESGQ